MIITKIDSSLTNRPDVYALITSGLVLSVVKTDPSPCLEPLTRNFEYDGELEFG